MLGPTECLEVIDLAEQVLKGGGWRFKICYRSPCLHDNPRSHLQQQQQPPFLDIRCWDILGAFGKGAVFVVLLDFHHLDISSSIGRATYVKSQRPTSCHRKR